MVIVGQVWWGQLSFLLGHQYQTIRCYHCGRRICRSWRVGWCIEVPTRPCSITSLKSFFEGPLTMGQCHQQAYYWGSSLPCGERFSGTQRFRFAYTLGHIASDIRKTNLTFNLVIVKIRTHCLRIRRFPKPVLGSKYCYRHNLVKSFDGWLGR